MKLRILVAFIFITSVVHAQDDSRLFFYIPEENEMSDFVSMMKYLVSVESGKEIIEERVIDIIFKRYIGKESLQSLLTESFLRSTRNKDVVDKTLKYISDYEIKTDFSSMLVKFYNSKIESYTQDGQPCERYVSSDGYYEENMKYFPLNEVGIIDDKLGTLVFSHDWNEISFEKDGKRDSFLIYGGGTNSMTMKFEKMSDVSNEDLDLLLEKERIENSSKEGWQLVELEKNGIIKISGTDRYIVMFMPNSDVFDSKEIDSATFNAYLYNSEMKVLYVMRYYINISTRNIFYDYRLRMYNYVLFTMIFGFIQ